MASKYCHECIRERSFQRPGHFTNMNEASLSDTIYFIRGVTAHKPCAVRVLSMAIRRNGRKCFVRLHNLNSNLENYINRVDGIKTYLAPTCQSPTCEGRSRVQVERGSQWGGSFYGLYRPKFWLFYGYRLIFSNYG